MSRLLARIMLAIFMLPVAAIVYLMVFAILEDTSRGWRDEVCLVASGLATAAFVAAYWILLWFRSVRWTTDRLFMTMAAGAVALIIGGVTGGMMTWVGDDLGAFLFGPVSIFSWLLLSVFIWRETKKERAWRVDVGGIPPMVCPACGYNMTGLQQTLCPECGARYTIDELVASQPGREHTEIERPPTLRRWRQSSASR